MSLLATMYATPEPIPFDTLADQAFFDAESDRLRERMNLLIPDFLFHHLGLNYLKLTNIAMLSKIYSKNFIKFFVFFVIMLTLTHFFRASSINDELDVSWKLVLGYLALALSCSALFAYLTKDKV